MPRGTRGVTFNCSDETENTAYQFSYTINLSNWTRKTCLMLHKLHTDHPQLKSLIEEIDFTEFVLKYLQQEKQRLDIRQKALTKLDSAQLEYHAGQK